ncbi:L-lysine 2,3-aminomutase [Novipirellula aureliae]|uniref:L-lysine 2,3-aminomutase n=1 Tax=Novipirellula aureliae TaxID=2527966 RepID=A0A5C6DKA7_9BACT|nr:EF-P beta-lysylation protein EpmB [Novipirellula aureliae]TWU37793.1 L-lysine 2,3-aminomutase [Novipirellula aureliae]
MSQTLPNGRPGTQPAKILTPGSNFVLPGSGAESTLFDQNRVDWDVDWLAAMRRSVRFTDQLRRLVGLPPESEGGERDKKQAESAPVFPTFVPLEFLRRIRLGNPNDPLLRQVLPTAAEEILHNGFVPDPVGDLDAMATSGLIHKYDGRVLLIASSACAVHCRYCFRREFPYIEAGSRRENWNPAIRYIELNEDIREVILSGGDPLTLVNDQLFELLQRIDSIKHVNRIRFHTRLPIVIPQRITASLCEKLRSLRASVWFVVHANHANELDQACLDRLGMLVDSGIPVLNQAVLLRGVNDDEDSLVELLLKLVDHKIQPYYLHQLDRVRGTKHFEVPIEKGLSLLSQIRRRLPGYAVPTYVSELAGQSSKTPTIERR